MTERVVYSFIVDQPAPFAHQAWSLAHSLILHCGAAPRDIALQLTPEVPAEIAAVFAAEGYRVHRISRFGDGKWCNKIMQAPNLFDEDCDRIVLLDTDMIAVGDLRPFLQGDRVQAKVVDCANPRLETLLELTASLGRDTPPQMRTDATNEPTIVGNANGGFYAIPRALVRPFHEAWRRWALWLFDHGAPLVRDGMTQHIDQVSAALAFCISGVPFSPAPSNVNYFLHFRADHSHFDPEQPISLLHYHQTAMNAAGELEPPMPLTPVEAAAVGVANRAIRERAQAEFLDRFRRAYGAN